MPVIPPIRLNGVDMDKIRHLLVLPQLVIPQNGAHILKNARSIHIQSFINHNKKCNFIVLNSQHSFINYYQQMHYIAIKITQITVFYVTIRAPTCFDPPGSSSGSSEGPY